MDLVQGDALDSLHVIAVLLFVQDQELFEFFNVFGILVDLLLPLLDVEAIFLILLHILLLFKYFLKCLGKRDIVRFRLLELLLVL